MAEVKVTITDERGNTSSVSTPTKQPTSKTPTQASKEASPQTPEAKESQIAQKGLAVASMVGSRAFNYTTSNIGKWSGNSRNQNTVNNIMSVVSIGAMAYVNVFLAAATVAVNVGTTALNNAYEQKWDRIKSNRRLEKAGYNDSKELVGRRH